MLLDVGDKPTGGIEMLLKTWRTATVVAWSCTLLGTAAWADHHEEKQPAEQEESKPEDAKTALNEGLTGQIMIAAMPVFVPPNMGAPAARLGGATRGPNDTPNIEALVPEAAGYTLREQPNLYWYLAGPTDAPIEFVLRDVEADETLVEATLPAAGTPGVQRIALADHGVKLRPGVEYFWMVKLVRNPADRGYDRLTGGGIERVTASEELARELAAEGASRPHVLAKAGIWYDAVDGFSQAIAASPGNRQLWNQRAALFEQVGLPAIALNAEAAPAYQRR